MGPRLSEHGTGWFNSGGLRGVGTREEDTLNLWQLM